MVNVSAPEGSTLSYEAESYRITKALTELCPLVPTELGTLDDLVETVARERPTGHPLLRPRTRGDSSSRMTRAAVIR